MADCETEVPLVVRQVLFELVERTGPALRHAGLRVDEGFQLFARRWPVWFPGYAYARLIRAFGRERHGGKHRRWPGWCHRVARDVFLLVAELLCVDQAARLFDFQVFGPAVHFHALVVAHEVERTAARADIAADKLHLK